VFASCRAAYSGSVVAAAALKAMSRQLAEPFSWPGLRRDKAEFEVCLTESVIDAVRLLAEAGIDVVSDGEYGKSFTWASYVHRRLKGIEWSAFTEAELKNPIIAVIRSRGREAPPEFYAEYDARVLAVARNGALSGRKCTGGN